MVTKEELVEYLRNVYDIQENDDSWYSLFVELDDGQRQVSLIEVDENFCRIVSPIGRVCESKLNDALDLMYEKVLGGLVKCEDQHYVSHAFFLDSVDSPADVSVLVYAVAKFACDIKEKILGAD